MQKVVGVLLVLLLLTGTASGGDMKSQDDQTFAYCYFMSGDPEVIGRAVPDHVAYWKGLSLDGYSGGPFVDGSGGMIVFRAESDEAAAKIAAGDPFVVRGLVDESWLKAWRVE